MGQREQESSLRELYAENLQRLFKALSFCAANHIHLYRVPCGIFPLNDEPAGERVLQEFGDAASKFGPRAKHLGIRVLMHPDQFVVLNSEKPHVVTQSIHILSRHALVFDRLQLPRSPWSALILHGGKTGRGKELIHTIGCLPENIRSRLVLENDEYAYSAEESLTICRAAGVPMVFDAHHHVLKEKLANYEDPSVAVFVEAARGTWPRADWQLAHISNGDFVQRRPAQQADQAIPLALFSVPWVEVEAKAKERAIRRLRKLWPELR